MYDETDIKKILARAFELRDRTIKSGLVSGSEKLSLEEIEGIASELGLSPEYVRQAVLEYEGIPNEEPFFLDTGNNHDVELRGYTKGRLDQKTWAELRSIIEYHFDSPGKVKRRPSGITWKAQPQGILKFFHTRKSPLVEVKSSGTKVTIRIKQSLKTYNKLLWPGYAALGGAAMLLGVAMMEAPEAIFFSAGLLLVTKLFHYWANRKKQKARRHLKDMMDELQTIITRRFLASEKSHDPQKQALPDMTGDEEETIEEDITKTVGKKTH